MPPYNPNAVRRHPLYHTWTSMKQRCYNKKHHAYHRYGGRGIKVCPEWIDDFLQFASDVGNKPLSTTLDRIDNNGDYAPGNCRWATAAEQKANSRPPVKKKQGPFPSPVP